MISIASTKVYPSLLSRRGYYRVGSTCSGTPWKGCPGKTSPCLSIWRFFSVVIGYPLSLGRKLQVASKYEGHSMKQRLVSVDPCSSFRAYPCVMRAYAHLVTAGAR